MLILCLSYFITTVSAMGGIHICNILSYLQFFVIKVIVGSPMVAHVGQDYTIFKNGKNTVDAWFTVAIVSVVKIQTDQNTSHISLDHEFFQSMSCYHRNPKSIIPFGKPFISGLVECLKIWVGKKKDLKKESPRDVTLQQGVENI